MNWERHDIDADDLRSRVRRSIFEGDHRTQKAYAKAIGVHHAVLSAFMSGSREPSEKLLEALGYELVVRKTYRKPKQKGL